MDENDLLKEILEYAQRFNPELPRWYAGISDDPKKRLFQDHCVDQNGVWIHTGYANSEIARKAERVLLEFYGFDGGAGGSDADELCVYAFLKTTDTRR